MAQKRCHIFGQAMLVACLLFVPILSQAQSRFPDRPSSYGGFSGPDQEKGKAVLAEFRTVGIAKPYYFEFDLHVIPYRVGDIRTVSGTIWGAHNALGPITRVQIGASENYPLERFLIQNGPKSSITFWSEKNQSGTQAASFEAIAGTDITPFDLQMPFIYWDNFQHEGTFRILSRPAHRFLLYPPKEITEINPKLKAIRVYLDTAYNALVKTEHLDQDMKPIKTMTLMDIKKVQDQWIPKKFEVRDEVTRRKTVILIKAAAMNIDLIPPLFEKEHLNIESPVLENQYKVLIP